MLPLLTGCGPIRRWKGIDDADAPRTLKFKVVVYLSIALSVAMLLFTGLVAWFLYTEILGKVSDHVTQLSEVITKSTRFAMLQNQPAYVSRIIHDVANQEKIDRIRDPEQRRKDHPLDLRAAEIGQWVDRNAEACSHCHQSEQPLEQMPGATNLDLQGAGWPVAAR